jgi:long-chain acyl-CoA synthetase
MRREAHFGRVMNCFADRPANVWAHVCGVIEQNPEVVAVVEGELELTYTQLDSQSAGLAALLSRSGVSRGDRVAVMLNNGVDAVRAVLAITRIGAVLLAIGTRSRAEELSHFFADAEPKAIIHGSEFSRELDDANGVPKCRINVCENIWKESLDSNNAAPTTPDIAEDDLFAILYTSGTTGKPKGAMLTHLGVVHSCLHWCDAFGLGDHESTLFCVPWTHVSGLCGVLMPFLFQGGKLVMMPVFKSRAALELAEAHAITHALMVPAMYGLCLQEPDLADFRLGQWRIAAYGGAPMPESTVQRFVEALPHLAMCNAYGATETTSPSTIMPPGKGTARADSIGRVVSCGELIVMDERGQEVPAGTDGEFWIAGPMIVSGYWQNPEATAKNFIGGYWRSGDIGSVDSEGYVRIADRKKDMIIRGGFKVYSAEVENVISGLNGVAEVAIVGRPDPVLDEQVIAYITCDDSSVTEDLIRDWCSARLSDYKVPEHVVLSTYPLPRNVNGKIQKALLRQKALELPHARYSRSRK